jgi:hypothetical protein
MFRTGNIPWNKGKIGSCLGEKNGMFGKKHKKDTIEKMRKSKRIETKQKMSVSRREGKYFDERNPAWVGGNIQYWHDKARKLFGKKYCEVCGISNYLSLKVNNKKLEMHNCLNPKNYKQMDAKVWMTVCLACHSILETNGGKTRERTFG